MFRIPASRFFLILPILKLFVQSGIAQSPVAQFAANPKVGCAIPHVVFFTDQSTLPDTWFWNFGDGNTSTLQNPVHAYTTTGVFSVSLTVTDTISGLSDVAFDTIRVSTVSANFTGNGSGLGTFGCGPLTVNFASTSSVNGSTEAVWLWDFGDGNTSTLQNPTHIYQTPGIYTVSLTTTDENGCSDTETKTFFAQVIGPDVNWGADTTEACDTLTVNFTDSTTFGAPIIAWNWTFGDGGTSNLQNPTHTYTSQGNFDVSLTITDIDGCSRTLQRDSFIVIGIAPAVLSIDSNVSCNGFSDGGITATVLDGTAPYSYLWSNGDTTASITGLAAATYTVTVTDADGCTSSNSAIISEPNLLVASTALDNTVSCNGLSDGGATASATGGTGAYTYAWSNSATTASITGIPSGTYSVTITDANGCTDSSSITITEPAILVSSTVVDNHISCNGSVDGQVTASAIGGTTAYTYLWSTGHTTATAGGLASGTYSVTITDANGCTDSSSISILEPTLLISSATVDNTVSCSGFSDGQASASASGGTGTYTYTWSDSQTTATAVNLVAGTYSVTITDANGCTDSSSVTVTAVDTTKPIVTCPGNINTSNDIAACGAIINYSVTSSDNCPGETVAQIAGLTSGSQFPIGTTTNTFVATDAFGNTDTCSFDIIVADTANPVTICPANISVFNDPGQCDAVVNYSVTTSDNCPGETLAQITGMPSGSAFPLGTTVNTFVTTDASGNTDTCSFEVIVTDTQAPAIVCIPPITVNSDPGICGAIVAYVAPIGIDSCPGAVTTLFSGMPSGSTFPVGITTNVFVVTDAAGNTDTCEFDVTVVDNEPPVISCPGNITAPNDPGNCGAVITYSINTSDNCGGETLAQITGLPSGSLFPAGVTINTFVATDTSGNTDTCSFQIEVNDAEAPQILCQSDTTVSSDAGTCDAVVSYTAPTFTDNCVAGNITQISGLASGSTFPIGATINTYVATDSSGNTDTCSFTITVVDDENPVITCPANITTSNDPGECSAVVTYGVTSSDNCTGETVTQIAGLVSGNPFPVGTTVNTFVVTDVSGNTDTCSFEVMVTDTQSPAIICPEPISQCETLVEFNEPIGTDNCPSAITTQSDVTGLSSGSVFPIGTTTLSYTVTDSSGNAQTCSFDVTVFDPPGIVLGPDTSTTDIEPVRLEATVTNYIDLEWSPPMTLDDPFIENPIASPAITTTFNLTAISTDGCEASDSITVFVTPENELVVTTLFTPNGDGRNDTWTLNKPALINGCKVAIFNRWGNQVFESTSYDNSWDGTDNSTGEPLPEATYYYLIQCDDQPDITGPITLLRVRQ